MKFWQCILNLICHHLSKFVVTIDKMASLKHDVLSRWPLYNFGSWTYFFFKLCHSNLFMLIQNLGVPFCHLSQVWILQTRLKIRPKFYFDTIACTLNFKFSQKVHFVILVNNFCWFWSVNYTFVTSLFQQFLISRNKSAFDLKFWPVIGLKKFTSRAKFDHLPAWFITDGFVNYQYDALLTELLVLSNWIFPSG